MPKIKKLIKAVTRPQYLTKAALSIFITGLLMLSGIQVFAQSVTWTGNVDADWHKASNWSSGQVPGSGVTVNIRPQGGNPYPVISEDVTIANLVISEWHGGGDLTVSAGSHVTVTDELTIHGDGRLIIESGGTVEITGNSFSMNQNTFIEVSSGTFISNADAILNGTFSSTDANITFNKGLTVSNHKNFYAGTSTVTVNGEANINGTYHGDDGITTFNSSATVQSGGIINLDQGEIIFNAGGDINNNGTVNMGSGTAKFQGSVEVESSGHFNVDDANIHITGDANFTSGGFLAIQSGTINVEGNASLSSGGEFNLESGALNVGEDATFEGGGVVNAGHSQMDIQGDLTVPYDGTFNADSSTVTFSGNHAQTIYTGGDDITFYNVTVTSGSSLQTDGSTENTVIIENDLSVEEGGQVGVQDDDTIDIQGNLDDQGEVESIQPFVYGISTPSLHEVVVIFDKEMDQASAERAHNYSIDNGVTISGAALDPSDPARVTLQVSTLTDNLDYELIVNDVFSADGGEISENHIKRFTTLVDITYYSRRSGRWNTPSSWSIESHAGPAASEIPNAQDGEDVIIGSNHTVTIGSSQDISRLNELVVDHTGTLAITSGGTLILDTISVTGGGTFELQEGGTLAIGSTEGIAGEGMDKGNVQTEFRSYSSRANYIYNGTTGQVTGSGLPEQVYDLYIRNGSGVTALNNLQVEGVLYLEEGSLNIPSGQGIIANNKSIDDGSLEFRRVLDGEPGWRMISSPVSAGYGNFLDGVLTQGFTGSDYESLQPNIMHYDETYEGTDNQRWRAPSSAADGIPAGLGYNLYLFGEIPEDDRYNDPLPDTLSVEGQEHAGPNGQIDLNVTYTTEADTGWNLVGNPYGASIDWDDDGSWTKKNIDETIYVWDPDVNSYRTWNGETGSLGSGLIPPFQAFWIKANAVNPELQVSEEAKTFGGEFVGKRIAENHPEIKVEVSHEGKFNSIFFSFFEDARVGKDPLDGYYLEPPPDTRRYVELYSVGRRKNRYSINSLPVAFGTPVEIPISASVIEEHQKISKPVQLRIAEMKNIPYSWEITLIDRITGEELNPTEGLQFSFTTSAGISPSGRDSVDVLKKEYQILAQANPDEARFALRIDPGALGSGLPTEIDLKQNYPNPFASQTTIRFALPIQNEVTLEVFDILGRKVAVLADNESYQAGLHSINWNASGVANGIYIYRLITEEKTISKKFTVIK